MTETHRYLLALLFTSLYVVWVAVLFYKHKKKTSDVLNTITRDSTLVVYASQSGTAEKIARAKAMQQHNAESTVVVSMASLSLSSLRNVSKAIFVVSTYGEGEPPDMGRKFNRALQQAVHAKKALFSHLQFEVVGLGDRQYQAFCQFAVSLFDGIEQLGGNAAKPLTTLDAGRGEHLSFLGEQADKPHNSANCLRLSNRTLLNGGEHSQAQPAQKLFALSFTSTNIQGDNNKEAKDKASMKWKAGDVLDVLIDENLHAATEHQEVSGRKIRSYTIASVPEEGDVKLVVRQLMKDDGTLGLGSGLLTHHLQSQQSITGFIRSHANADITDTQAPLLLIGAGSGVAGLRAQLAKRALLKDAGPVWILFGERNPELDDILDTTLSPFHLSSCLIHKHTVFSQGKQNKGYVQHLLQQHGNEIRRFLGHSGHVYVCGRYEGMGKGVDDALRNVLGDAAYQALQEAQRYHRDLY